MEGANWLKLKCNHCKCKDNYKLTRGAYDDMEYIGFHEIECRGCGRKFHIAFEGVYIRVVK